MIRIKEARGSNANSNPKGLQQIVTSVSESPFCADQYQFVFMC